MRQSLERRILFPEIYVAGSAIGAALPSYPGTQPVLLDALIRHVLVLPNNNFFHCGVMCAATSLPANCGCAESTVAGANYIPVAEYVMLSGPCMI